MKHKLSHQRAIVMNLCKEFGYNFMPAYMWYEERKKANIPVFNSQSKKSDTFTFDAKQHEIVEGYSFSANGR